MPWQPLWMCRTAASIYWTLNARCLCPRWSRAGGSNSRRAVSGSHSQLLGKGGAGAPVAGGLVQCGGRSPESAGRWRGPAGTSSRCWRCPYRVSDKVLGLAVLSTSSDHRQFTPDEIELVWGIANSVALAVDNARLYAETRQRLAESQGLQRVAAALLHKISPEEVLEVVCAEAQQLTGAAGSAVLLLEEAGWLHVTYSSGTDPAFFDRIPVAESLAGIAVRRDEPFLTNAPANESYEYLQGKRPTAFLAVPLHANGDIIGVFEVVDKPGGFVQDDIRIIGLFANQAAINIEHVRLNCRAGRQ